MLRFSDEPCERPRFAWSEVYTETAKDTQHAACISHHGTIIRWRIDHSDHYVYRQRITDPTSASQWSTWTKSSEYVTSLLTDVHLDVWTDDSSGNLFGCWISGGWGVAAYWAYSTDDGATWSGSSLLKDWGSGYPVQGIAGVAAGGTTWLVVAVNNLTAGDNAYLELFTGSGTTKPTSASTSGATLCDPRGIGVARDAAGKLTVWYADKDPTPLDWGAEQAPPCLGCVEWTSGGGWGSYTVMRVAGVGGPITFQYPRLAVVEADAVSYRYVGTFGEVSTSPSYARAVVCFTPKGTWITEEVPWRYACTWGVEVLKGTSYWYVVQSDRAYRSAVFSSSATGARLDVDESRVRSVALTERANEPGEAVIVLDNSDGYLDGAGTAGATLCVRPGAQVGLAFGYRTSAGRELVFRGPLWVSRVEHGRDGRKRVVTVEARDAWAELGALRARRDLQLSAVSVGTLIRRVWWRVCESEPAIPGSGPLAVGLAYWRVTAGERWSSQLAKLARAGGRLIRFYNDDSTGVGLAACAAEWLVYGSASGGSAWTIGGSGGSPFYQGRWWRAAQPFHSAMVEGEGYLGESRDWASIWSEWRDVVATVSDRRLDSQQDADDRATAEAAFLAGGESGGVVRVGLVPGLEVGDVVTVTDELAGLTAATWHVRAMVSRVELAKGLAEQELTLEGLS